MSFLEQYNMNIYGIKTANESYFNIKIRQLCLKLLKEDPTQIIGYKAEASGLVIATNCQFDKKYNEENYKDYFAFYTYNSYPPFIENETQIKEINNDEIIVKKTNLSKVYYLKF